MPGLTGVAYTSHLSRRGRPSWDPMTALFSVIGDAETAGYRRVYGEATVSPRTGANRFEVCEGGRHAYLVKEKEDSFYKHQIDEILMTDDPLEAQDA